MMLLCACRAEDPSGSRTQAVSSAYDLSAASAQVAPRVKPGGSLAVRISARNSGTSTWRPADVKLFYTGGGGFSGGTLTLGSSTPPGGTGTFTGTLSAPTQIGRFDLSWQARASGAAFGAPVAAATEVTCSDGVFCNGDERYVNGACIAGPPPCDDGVSCTTDVCDEAQGTCVRTLGANCAACAAKRCNPNCKSAVCGDDGCGGSCGSCGAGQVCQGGACIAAVQAGTCSNPLGLTGAGPAAPLAPGFYSVTGDTSDGYNEVVPTCNSTSTAKEKVYQIVVNQVMGIDAQSSGFDTVLHLRQGSCGGATIACSDDAAPPGNYGSHIAAMLQPGTYELVVDGFDDHAFGPFTLAVRAVANCLPQCDGKFCGDDNCGGTCGTCAAGQVCNSLSRCIADPCTPACQGRQCGSDGCGGSCGTCSSGRACDDVTGACKAVKDCNPDRPVCKTSCATNQYCGTDCECHRARDPRPDLVLNRERLQSEILFETVNISPSSCAVVEGCVGGTGDRRLLRFSVEAVNQGTATMNIPAPKTRPDLFQYSPCHGHYHFKGFATYALLDQTGKVVIRGLKQAYCMEDTRQVLVGPTVACTKEFDCTNQGIQSGWSDLYGNGLDCQWLDITGVPSGNYQLQVSVNPNRIFEEGSFDNNSATVPVAIP